MKDFCKHIYTENSQHFKIGEQAGKMRPLVKVPYKNPRDENIQIMYDPNFNYYIVRNLKELQFEEFKTQTLAHQAIERILDKRK